MQEFPGYDFTLVPPRGIWWYSGGKADPRHIEMQDNGAFTETCAYQLSCQLHLPQP